MIPTKSFRTEKSQNKNESMSQSSESSLSGYESKLEIYLCQRYFLKIYEGTTPKGMMQDLLKNKLVEESALSLVKSMTDIEDL